MSKDDADNITPQDAMPDPDFLDQEQADFEAANTTEGLEKRLDGLEALAKKHGITKTEQ